MCGIAGFVSATKNKEKQIKKMTDKIAHRGPDGEGIFTDDLVAFGHRRLSIIDIENGSQPMFNKDKSIVVIFNGEIYNYIELKEELISLGYKFKTKSDTEVLVHGYSEWKTNLPKKLRGMFAFAVYDTLNKEVFIARDNFGIKPLYYAYMNDTFMFSSEIKALLEHESFTKELNEDILKVYLEFSFVPTNETFFKGVHRLDAGHSLLFKNNKVKIDRYFKLDFKHTKKSFEDVTKNIGNVMKDSVEKHLLADVEVGSFLSSGIDSSYIVSLAKPDKTYSVGYEDPKYDESILAKELTDELGISNKTKKISKKEYMDIMPKVMYHLEEPTSDPAAVALYFVAKLASKDVKVVLSGEGADEFFGGYNSYSTVLNNSIYEKAPFFMRKCISKVSNLMPENRLTNYLIRSGKTLEENYIGVNRNFTSKMADKVLNNTYSIKTEELTKDVFERHKDASDLDKMQALDINFWLMKDILLKADKMTMANSIEGRVPFLDKEVFKVAASLPLDYKINKETTKVALRAAAKEVIPNNSYKKKKLGFPVPVREWIKEDDFYEEILKSFNSNAGMKYFNNSVIVKMLDEHKENKKDNYRNIWAIYCFLKWYEVYFVNDKERKRG